MTTLTVTTSHDYSGDVLNNIDEIAFNTAGASTAIFDAIQFDDAHISQTVQVTGDANPNNITVLMNAAGTFSAAGWTFANWGSLGDLVSIGGSSGADTITGASVPTHIAGGDGADTLIGGASGDIFLYNGASYLQAGESIDGGGGVDQIELGVPGSFDFSGVSVTSVETLHYSASGATTAILAGDQIGTGAIMTVIGTGGAGPDALVVAGSAVDLSAVAFQNWTNGDDTIDIKGTVGADMLTGSDQDDLIQGFAGDDTLVGGAGSDVLIGGRGKDSLGGGGGGDHFDFNSIKETKTGSKHDTIIDFKHSQHDKIDLSTIDAKTGGGNQKFDFIGRHDFNGKKGELHYVKHGGAVTVEGDVNGDGHADFQIKVDGAGHLAGSDFIL